MKAMVNHPTPPGDIQTLLASYARELGRMETVRSMKRQCRFMRLFGFMNVVIQTFHDDQLQPLRLDPTKFDEAQQRAHWERAHDAFAERKLRIALAMAYAILPHVDFSPEKMTNYLCLPIPELGNSVMYVLRDAKLETLEQVEKMLLEDTLPMILNRIDADKAS